MLRILIGTSVFLFLLALFLQMTSRFTGLGKNIDYVFLAALGFLFISILFRTVLKTSVNAGFISFSDADFFILDKDKQTQIEIPADKIEQVLFKPGHSADYHPPVSYLLGAVGLFLGSYEGDDSVLLVKSGFGPLQYNVKFETASQLEIFLDILKNHPNAVIIHKK
ncbi:MAG: hypothetical protein V2I46_07730 [Bacteroides sp.]|nr:hypothetical protein [Bacteroides sp.]